MKPFLAAVMPLLFAGCMPVEALSTPPQMTAAADATAITASATYAPSVQYTPRQVTEPEDWRSLNDAQAPSGGN